MARLLELCELIVDCEHKTAPTQETGYPSIRTPNIGRGRLILDGVNRVSEETYHAWTQREVPQPGDLILAREAPIGNVAIIPAGLKVCLGQRTVLIRANRKAVNSQYLTYLLLGDEIQGKILSISNGATVHHLNMKDIRELELPPLPTPQIQDRIADTLSAYDDLIENNTRRINILEDTAQMIYREWFVHFRFPGHENVRMVESELGAIPEGWVVEPLEQLVEEFIDYRGKTPAKLSADWSKTGILALSALNVKQGRLVSLEKAKYVDEDLYKRWMKTELQAGDILMTSEAPLGEVYFLPETRRYCLSQRVFSIRPENSLMHPSLLFFFLSSSEGQSQLKARASGTTVLGIRQADLRRIPILRPPLPLQQDGDSKLLPFLLMIDVLQRKVDNLRTTRDFLLPKLISGEVPVEAADEAAAELVEQTA
jgi:type I restriction enzyme S subunit